MLRALAAVAAILLVTIVGWVAAPEVSSRWASLWLSPTPTVIVTPGPTRIVEVLDADAVAERDALIEQLDAAEQLLAANPAPDRVSSEAWSQLRGAADAGRAVVARYDAPLDVLHDTRSDVEQHAGAFQAAVAAAATPSSPEPAAPQPAVSDPAVPEPAVQEPAATEPAVEQPAVEQPAVPAPEPEPEPAAASYVVSCTGQHAVTLIVDGAASTVGAPDSAVYSGSYRDSFDWSYTGLGTCSGG